MRVAFAVSGYDARWLGGVNYLRNLLGALRSTAAAGIEPVLLCAPSETPEQVFGALDLEVLRTPLLQRRHPLWVGRKALQRVTGQDPALGWWLRQHGVQLLSHSGPLGRYSPLPSLSWIPDFQHRRLPEFFSPEERRQRDRDFHTICRESDTVLLSSETARQDLRAFAPAAVDRSAVLRFVSALAETTAVPDMDALASRYGLQGPYFHVPNQFWVHKNHSLLIEALSRLRRAGRPVQVVATGNPRDHKQPHHYERLVQQAAAAGVEADFRVLGLVPYADLVGLMHHAVAVVNPSLFEGWSTSVEEGKSLGKAIVLSDIAVHLEQAPPRGRYFAARDADSLAAALRAEWDAFDPAADAVQRQQAVLRQPARRAAFAQDYAGIAQATVARFKSIRKGFR